VSVRVSESEEQEAERKVKGERKIGSGKRVPFVV
jgi:hypothetical protein